MTPEQRKAVEYRAAVFAMLDHIEEREMEASTRDNTSSELLSDLWDSWQHAKAAFSGITYAEFTDISGKLARKRKQPGKAGRPPKPLLSKLDEPLAKAARDFDRIREYWEATPEGTAGVEPPVPHIDLAADFHDLSSADLGERVRRPKSRNPHKLIDRP